MLRKKLTEDDEFLQDKTALVQSIFGGKVSQVAVDIIATASRQRWSSTPDFGTALRRQNSLVVLAAAERDGSIESVEDELFRFRDSSTPIRSSLRCCRITPTTPVSGSLCWTG